MIAHIDLSPAMENFICDKVASGSYASASEVIHEALRRLQAELARSSAWNDALAQGNDELDRGESVPYTQAALDDITQKSKT